MLTQKNVAIVSVAALLSGAGFAAAQYETGFEDPPFSGSASGEILTGQDGFYNPVSGSADFRVYTYAGNTLGIPNHPVGGGDQFAAGRSEGGSALGRTQRDMNWVGGVVEVTFDICIQFDGTPPATQYAASFSSQDSDTTASYIHLFDWIDLSNPTSFNANYYGFTETGAAHTLPGLTPGPAWQNLEVGKWYRLGTVIDFNANQIVSASITDLDTMTRTEAQVTGVYLRGGSAGGFPLPNGFRFFAGGGTAGNISAWDNLEIEPMEVRPTLTVTGACPGIINIAWANATPNRQMGIVFASNEGNVVIPSGPCRDTQLGLGSRNIQLAATISTGPGSGNVNANAPSAACGGFLQLVIADDSPCTTSNVAQIP